MTQTGPFTGAGGLIFSGPGTHTLNQANTFTGTTNLTGGTLQGTGVTKSLAVTGGTLAPGTSPGIFAANGTVTLGAAGKLAIELNGLTPGTLHDQLAVTGPVSVGGSLQVIAGFVAADQDKFVIVSNDGTDAVTGTFSGLPEGAIVTGGVNFLRVLGGFDLALAGQNADAAIGAITVGADWRASTVLAGAKAGTDGHEGTSDDTKIAGAGVRDTATIFSQIASITIKGQAFGSTTIGDSFGIVAEQIGKAKIGAATLKLTKGQRSPTDFFALAITGPGPAPDNAASDFFLREIVA